MVWSEGQRGEPEVPPWKDKEGIDEVNEAARQGRESAQVHGHEFRTQLVSRPCGLCK